MTSTSSSDVGMSGSGDDLLGTDQIEPVDGLRPNETSIVLDSIGGDSAARTSARSNSRPIDGELVARQHSDATVNPTGNDPFDIESFGVVGGSDDHGSRVLDFERVDSIHGVDTDEAIARPVSRQVAGESARVEHGSEGGERHNGECEISSGHHEESTSVVRAQDVDVFVFARWMKVSAALLLLVIAGGIAFAVFEPIQVLPRIRLAPGYSLDDQTGSHFTSETVRGSVTLYTFASLDCDATCDDLSETMNVVRERARTEIDLGDTDLRFVTIVLDSAPTTQQLVETADRFGAEGDSWTVVGGDQSEIRNVVSTGFGRFYDVDEAAGVRFDAGFVLVDGAGVIRGDYRYQTLADDADKLVRHIDILATELRHSSGSAAVAYEAAHLFLCYP